MFVNQGDAPELERDINAWLELNDNIEVLHVKQSYTSDEQHMYALVSVWYRDIRGKG